MPTYDIYVLQEDDISISGMAELDGDTQGTGEHLLGVTLTLNTPNWMPITITEPDDSDFRDNDGNQRLDGAATLNGTTYTSGTRVEAEYGLVISDGTNSWTLVGFNVRDSSPSYATVEGLAFIGGPGGFPPVGVPLTVTSNFEGPNFESADYATPICMAEGTRVATPDGLRAIEDIGVGDAVLTRDHGVQIVRWHGTRKVLCQGSFAPVRFETGAIGNDAPLTVSQQHRVLIQGWQAELLFGVTEMLVPAVHLVNDKTIRVIGSGEITYHHIMLDAHAVIDTNGSWTETLHAGDQALRSILPRGRAELMKLFPELEGDLPETSPKLSYPIAKRREAGLLRQL